MSGFKNSYLGIIFLGVLSSLIAAFIWAHKSEVLNGGSAAAGRGPGAAVRVGETKVPPEDTSSFPKLNGGSGVNSETAPSPSHQRSLSKADEGAPLQSAATESKPSDGSSANQSQMQGTNDALAASGHPTLQKGPAQDATVIQTEQANLDTPRATPITLSQIQLRGEDPHICQKPDDVYYGHWGMESPVGPSMPQYSNPKFLFDLHHEDNTINWAEGFSGTVPVCFVVDERGTPVDVRFPQPPGENIQEHIKDRIAGWRYSPGTMTMGYWDHDPKPIKVQLGFSFLFQ